MVRWVSAGGDEPAAVEGDVERVECFLPAVGPAPSGSTPLKQRKVRRLISFYPHTETGKLRKETLMGADTWGADADPPIGGPA